MVFSFHCKIYVFYQIWLFYVSIKSIVITSVFPWNWKFPICFIDCHSGRMYFLDQKSDYWIHLFMCTLYLLVLLFMPSNFCVWLPKG